MKTKIITILMALLVVAGGAQAQGKKKEKSKGKARATITTQKDKQSGSTCRDRMGATPIYLTKDEEKQKEEKAEDAVETLKYFTGTVLYVVKELPQDDKDPFKPSHIASDEYLKDNQLPQIDGEEMRCMYGEDFCFMEYKELRIYCNPKGNTYVVAFRPDTSNTTYFSRMTAEEFLGDENMVFRDIIAARWDGENKVADDLRDKFYIEIGKEAILADLPTRLYTFKRYPEKESIPLWIIPEMRVDTWTLPFYGFDYMLADAVTNMPFHKDGQLFHIQYVNLIEGIDQSRWETMTHETEIEWPRLREMISNNGK